MGSNYPLWDPQNSFDSPPALPMFGPPPKCQKKESFTDAMANAVAKAINSSTSGAQEDSSKSDFHCNIPMEESGFAHEEFATTTFHSAVV